MRKLLLLIPVLALLAACSTPSGDIGRLKRENDSLKAALKNYTLKDCLITKTGGQFIRDTSWINDMIDTSVAHTEINSWKNFCDANEKKTIAGNYSLKHRAFLVNIYDLAHAISDSEHTSKMVFYLGMAYDSVEKDSAITLMYVPAKEIFNPQSKTDSLEIMPMMLPGNNQAKLYDHTLPCPTCDIIGAPFNIGM